MSLEASTSSVDRAQTFLDEVNRDVLLHPSFRSEILPAFGNAAVSPIIDIDEHQVPHDTYTKFHNEETLEVEITSSVTLADFEAMTDPAEMDRLRKYAEVLRGREIMFVNATAAGGGVAIMRAPLVHLMKLLGIDAHWYALKPEEKDEKAFFDVTKHKFHNVLQSDDVNIPSLTEDDEAIYTRVVSHNAGMLRGPLSRADVVVIDDWQPAGFIPHLKGDDTRPGINPDAKILFRDHIQTEGSLMSTPGTPQYKTWEFIWEQNRVSAANIFITHPMDEFVPPDVPDHKVVFMPATADLLDDLNRPLSELELEEGLAFINEQLELNENQTPIDQARPYIVLIARFDPWKGMPQGIESYAKARARMIGLGVKEEDLPQLVVLGNGSVDDPDGIPLLAEIMSLRSAEYGDIKDDIKVARVPHNDQAINTVLKGATLALQPSTKEGFESRVSDAIFQGVPVIGSERGGIPLQIVEGESGHVADPFDTDRWAELITSLMTDKARYSALRDKTIEHAKTTNRRFTTVPNAIRWLGLSARLLQDDGEKFVGDRRWADELIA
jgi:glycosyltransferase involved in cell wall biosynthesis